MLAGGVRHAVGEGDAVTSERAERKWSARAGCRPSGRGEVVGPGWRAVAGPLGVSVGRADLGMGWKLGWVR